MSHSTLINAQLKEPLRALALTVDETAPGEFRWRILESYGNPMVFDPVSCSDISFAAYDTALATGYGELQRLVGPDLQYGPRRDLDAQADLTRTAAASRPKAVAANEDLEGSGLNGATAVKPGGIAAA